MASAAAPPPPGRPRSAAGPPPPRPCLDPRLCSGLEITWAAPAASPARDVLTNSPAVKVAQGDVQAPRGGVAKKKGAGGGAGGKKNERTRGRKECKEVIACKKKKRRKYRLRKERKRADEGLANNSWSMRGGGGKEGRSAWRVRELKGRAHPLTQCTSPP